MSRKFDKKLRKLAKKKLDEVHEGVFYQQILKTCKALHIQRYFLFSLLVISNIVWAICYFYKGS